MVGGAASKRASESPGITVVLPFFNAARYLGAALRSVSDQSFSDLEIICVDDGSTDESAQIVQNAASMDARILLIRHEENLGAPAARNRAIAQARGRYLVFMDADDELVQGSLKSLFQAACREDYDAVKGLMLVNNGGKSEPHGLNQRQMYTCTTLAECEEIQHLYQYTTYLFKASLLRSHEVRFDTTLRNFQDPVFLSRLLPLCARIHVTLLPFYLRFLRDDSIVSSRWEYRNYESIVRGASDAHAHLLAVQQLRAATKMRQTFYRWWSKFETMTDVMTRDQCLSLYAQMSQLRPCVVKGGLRERMTKAGAAHALALINRGDYDACYRLMHRSVGLSRWLPRGLLKAYQLCNHLLAHQSLKAIK